ncbi:hypothetical protein ABZ297_06135 [Nonomuraea sp. NPDC005983]|uniref:hypothetical protein n=1 Tax=Nonomuraea sp. NPDC005983 TaxID=3155595 RepID=UPI0033AC3286
MSQDEAARIHNLPAIRALGDALVDDIDGTSPVSHLEEASGFPANMRMGTWALGVLGWPLANEHDKIVGYAENKVNSTIEGLRAHRDRLHTVADNVQTADQRNEDHVRRI